MIEKYISSSREETIKDAVEYFPKNNFIKEIIYLSTIRGVTKAIQILTLFEYCKEDIENILGFSIEEMFFTSPCHIDANINPEFTDKLEFLPEVKEMLDNISVEDPVITLDELCSKLTTNKDMDKIIALRGAVLSGVPEPMVYAMVNSIKITPIEFIEYLLISTIMEFLFIKNEAIEEYEMDNYILSINALWSILSQVNQ